MLQMIIANRLTDGLVVFLSPAGEWVMDIEDGVLIESDEHAESSLERARVDERECLVIDPNLISVEIHDDRRRPTAIREAIRAFGPSAESRTDFAVER
jgi:hypothetical protein